MKYILYILFFIIIASCDNDKHTKKSIISNAEENTKVGDYYRRINIPDSAFTHYLKAEKIYKELNDSKNLGIVQYKIAYIYYKIGDFSRAKISSLNALYLLKEEKDIDKELYKVYNLLGIICRQLQEYDKSVEYHTQSLELTKHDITYNPYSLNNLGFLYQSMDNNEMAIDYFKQALQDKNISQERPALYAMLLDNLAYSQLKLKQHQELPGLFYKAMAIRDSLQIIPGIVINKLHLSEYYQDQKDNDKTLQFAEEAYIAAKEKGVDATDVLMCLKQLRKVNPANETAYLSEYIKISDSIKSIESQLSDKIAKAEFDKNKLVTENKELEKDNRNIIVTYIIAILILIIAFLIWLYFAKSKEVRLKEERRIANEEIYTLLLSRSEQIKEQINKNNSILHNKLQEELNKILEVRITLDASNNRNDQLAILDRSYCVKDLKDLELSLMDVSDHLKVEEKDDSFAILLNELFDQHPILNIKFDIPTNIKWSKISSIVKVNLYKILKESVNNIIKHSNAKEVFGGLVVQDNNLILTIVDDGIGFDTNKTRPGSGLKNMQIAAKMINGTLKIKSSKKGTIIKVKTKL